MRKTGLKRWAIPFLLCAALAASSTLAASCALLGYSFSSTGYGEPFGPTYDKGTELNILSGRDLRLELDAHIDEGRLAVKLYDPSGTLVREYSIASSGVTQESFPYKRGVWVARVTSEGGRGSFQIRLHDKRAYEGFQE
jgi:hypothetical protein